MRRCKHNDYALLQDKWRGEVVVCIASGPSLTQEDVDKLRGKARVITVNSSFRIAPWADIHYSNDHDWWQEYGDEVRETCTGELWTGHHTAGLHQNLKTIPFLRQGKGLQRNPACINWGGNSGFAALQLAYKTNPRLIGLLGYDMKMSDQGQWHWHPDHPDHIKKGADFENWTQRFQRVADDFNLIGLPVINFTRDTALECFPRGSIEDYI
jgi:hypothetical protein